MIDHGFVLAEVAEAELRQLPQWEIVAPASMAIVNFRFVADGRSTEELDKLNSGTREELLRRTLQRHLQQRYVA